jgi:hypothetical protein
MLMNRKYDGHAWSKVITITLKNGFDFSFKKVHCLGHLHYVGMDYNCLVCSRAYNETTWVGKLAQVPLKMLEILFVSNSQC